MSELLNQIGRIIGIIGIAIFLIQYRNDIRKTRLFEVIRTSNISADDKNALTKSITILLATVIVLSIVLVSYCVYFFMIYQDVKFTEIASDNYLAHQEPTIFRNSPDGSYEYARIYPRNSVLYKDTLIQTFSETEHSFDMFALNGKVVIRNYHKEILDRVANNVKFRFIFIDPSPKTRVFYDPIARASRKDPEEYRKEAVEVRKQIADLKRIIESDPLKYTGSIEVRWLQEPIFYSTWIKDGEKTTGVGHVSLYVYRNDSDRPAFRFSQRMAPQVVKTMQAEFNELWNKRARLI